MKIGIVGFGVMGTAFYKGLIKTFDKKDIYVCDKDVSKLFEYNKTNTTTHFDKLLDKCEVLIIAVKPQSFDELVKNAGVEIKNKLIISIMAGITIDRIRQKTGSDKIVRAMPNLPVEIKKGMIGWTATEKVSAKEKELIKIIFDPLGEQIELENESRIDFITALSGSGPAYFFYLAELIAEKAKKMGFSEKEAMLIAEQTLIGSGCLVEKNKSLSVTEWKESVTSKGGTTEAALNHLKNSDFSKVFEQAIEEAVIKAKELNF
jgi:pyrroline-5-carboxylate reductase